MKHDIYLTKEWSQNKPVPMDEKELDELIRKQAITMRAAQDNGK